MAGSLACGPAATYRLPPTSGSSDQEIGELKVQVLTDVHSVPARGWDLELQLALDWRGQERSRVDLTRALVRVDEVTWSPCRPPADVDRDSLLLVLEPGAHRTATLRCQDIPKPGRRLEVRIHVTGTGTPGGYLDLSFSGVN